MSQPSTAVVSELVQRFAAGAQVDETIGAGAPFLVAIDEPVIYAGTAGGGPGEYAASSNPAVPNVHEINMIPSGQILVAFWQPLDNVSALSSFSFVDVQPFSSHDVKLYISSPGVDARLRIKITVLYIPDDAPGVASAAH
ncbi:MAG TPA: hypothetical protein VIA62_06765 [Thermoanaerobaculia bacterium]|jgi:hypothetical protein|nr:hypothetical protein [Thermoanaerobaculia bacterium]